MKKILTAAVALGCVAVMTVGFSACDFSSKSAYQVALENGFQGTEQEWLDSLHGADGEDGEDLDVEEVYAAALKNGYDGTFLDFLKEYLSVDVSENNNTDVLAHNLMSVVSVYCSFKYTSKSNSWIGGTATQLASSAGSGVIYDLNKEAGSAYVITNYHVVYDADSDNGIADSIYLYLYGGLNQFNTATGKDEGGSGIPAIFVGGASEYDIAVLKIQGSSVLKNSDAEEVEIGDSEEVTVGEKVYAVGNPEGEGISVTSGAISVDSEYIGIASILGEVDPSTHESKEVRYRVMRTDAAINSGNSGGGLFDAQGKLIGITNAKLLDSLVKKNGVITSIDSIDNMGYALPITQVSYVVKNILDNGGTLRRATLGVTVQTVDSKGVLDAKTGKAVIEETVKVSAVTPNSLGYRAFNVGDVFKSVTVNGKTTPIKRRHQIIDQMLNVRQGDTVKVTVIRGGTEKELSLTFDKDNYFTAVA